MIYTRFGNKVKILSGDIEKNEVNILVIYKNKVEKKETFIHELKADEGLKEIHQEIIKANQKRDKYINGGNHEED